MREGVVVLGELHVEKPESCRRDHERGPTDQGSTQRPLGEPTAAGDDQDEHDQCEQAEGRRHLDEDRDTAGDSCPDPLPPHHQHCTDEQGSQEEHVEGGDPAVHEEEVVEHGHACGVHRNPGTTTGRADEQVDREHDDQARDQARETPAERVVAEDPHRGGDEHLAERRMLAVGVETGGRVGVGVAGTDRPAQQPSGRVDVVRLVEDQRAVGPVSQNSRVPAVATRTRRSAA